MAAPKGNLLSLGHEIGMERNTFKRQRQHSQKNSASVHLLQRLHELKKREHAAKLYNKQLLQQFEEAQGTLRGMITSTAAMKTIQIEYERYLEESYPQWQQQLKERRQAAQRKRIEERMTSCQKSTKDEVAKSSADQLLTYQNSYNQDDSLSLPFVQSSWPTHPQPRRPVGAPPYPFQHHPLVSMSGHNYQAWPWQNAPDQASLQPDYPWSWTAGIPSVPDAVWDQLNVEHPPAERETLQAEAETSRASSSKTGSSGGKSSSSRLSQELDIKPVRLSNVPAESTGSSSESSEVNRGKRKRREKRGSSKCSSSDRKGSISQNSSKTSSIIVTAAPNKVSQISVNSISSEEGSTSMRGRKNGGHDVEIPKTERATKDKNRKQEGHSESHKEESSSEKTRIKKTSDQSDQDKSESSKEESGSQKEEKLRRDSKTFKNITGDLSSGSEESGAEEEVEEAKEDGKLLTEVDDDGDGDGDGDENEDSREEVQEEDTEDNVSERQDTTDEEEEMGAEEEEQGGQGDQEEKSDGVSDEEKGNQPSTSSQKEELDEEQSDRDEEKVEEDGDSGEEEEGGEEAKEQKGEESREAEVDSDSDDSIISPQNKSKKLHVIPEDVREDDEEGSESGGSDEDSQDSGDDDIEDLLAPQGQNKEQEEKEQEDKEKPKAFCGVQIFQVKTEESPKKDQPSDSEEFDHFYD